MINTRKMLLSDALSPGSYMTLAVTLVTSQSGHLLPLIQTLERSRERDALSHTHTHTADRELFELFKHVRFSSLYHSVSLVFTLSQWYLILHSVGIGFISWLDQTLLVMEEDCHYLVSYSGININMFKCTGKFILYEKLWTTQGLHPIIVLM